MTSDLMRLFDTYKYFHLTILKDVSAHTQDSSSSKQSRHDYYIPPQIISRIAKIPAVPLTETEEEECLPARAWTLHQILAAAECSHLTNFTCNQIMYQKQAYKFL